MQTDPSASLRHVNCNNIPEKALFDLRKAHPVGLGLVLSLPLGVQGCHLCPMFSADQGLS